MASHIQPLSQPCRGSWSLLLLLLCSLAHPPDARAQGEGVYYIPDTSFKIPIQKDPSEKRIQQVLLYVSTDYGRSYQQVAAANPREDWFQFRANGDGWYWFSVRTQDTQGTFYPTNLNQLNPGLKICVDTVRPQVSLRGIKHRDWPVGVEWDIQDENPNLLSLQMDYRAEGSQAWIPLNPQQLARGDFGWTPRENGRLEVRLRVRDKAENEQVVTTVVTPGQGAAPGVGSQPGNPPNPGMAPGRVVMVNKRNVNLNFKIDNVGKSDVSEVEVWVTQDMRTWQKYGKAQKDPPYSVELHAEGRYGFTLVAVSGVGLSVARPRAGDPPQIWIELDETEPVVRLTDIVVGRGIDSGKLTIRWVASDKYLKSDPIRLLYGTTPQGPWTPITEHHVNDGVYVWRMPDNDDLPFQFHVKVEAEDQAGNIGSDHTAKPIAVDLNIPKVSVIGVDAKPLR